MEGPIWLLYIAGVIGGTATIIAGLGVIWVKVIQPARAVTKAKRELLHNVSKAFTPNGKTITEALSEVAGMTAAATMVAETAQRVAESAIEAIQQQQAIFTRHETYTHERNHEFANVLTKLLLQATNTASALIRIEAGDRRVARDLLKAQLAVEGVAEDLEASHQRADEVDHDTPGAAADAASKSASDES